MSQSAQVLLQHDVGFPAPAAAETPRYVMRDLPQLGHIQAADATPPEANRDCRGCEFAARPLTLRALESAASTFLHCLMRNSNHDKQQIFHQAPVVKR